MNTHDERRRGDYREKGCERANQHAYLHGMTISSRTSNAKQTGIPPQPVPISSDSAHCRLALAAPSPEGPLLTSVCQSSGSWVAPRPGQTPSAYADSPCIAASSPFSASAPTRTGVIRSITFNIR